MMSFLLILLFGVGIVSRVYSGAIPARDDEGDVCPPPENIAPCTCFKAPITERVTGWCRNFTNPYDLKAVLDNNPGWGLQDFWVSDSVMSFLPADLLTKAHFQSLNVSNTVLDTIFDKKVDETPELNLYMSNVRIHRTFLWSSISKANLLELMITNQKIKSFSQEFKDNVPKGVQRLWFEDTGVSGIKNQAFSHLNKLKILTMKGGNLKKLSRDMFPRPWIINYLDFSDQKIAALPEDFFADMPDLSFFIVERNFMTTIPEKVFTMYEVFYAFEGNPIDCNCRVKWITEKIKPVFLQGTCAEPNSLKGTKLGDLKTAQFRFCH